MITSGQTRLCVERHLDRRDPSLTIRLQIDERAVRIRETQMGVRIQLDGWPRSGRLGGPGIPSRVFWIALPARTAARSAVTARAVEQAPLRASPTVVAPLRPPRHDVPDRARAPLQVVRKVEDHYRAEAQSPRPLARMLGSERVGSTTLALIEVNPLTCTDAGLSLARHLEITLPLDIVDEEPTSAGTLVPMSVAQSERLQALAQALADNAVDVMPGRALRALPVGWDYLIITDDTTWNPTTKTPGSSRVGMVNAFQVLAEWKRRIGLKARVVKVADIVTSRSGSGFGVDFASGAADLQETLRRFLRWAHDTWGTAYVLFGGDEQVVPIRRLAIGSGWNPSMPTDLYYAALNPLNDEWTEGRALDYGHYGFDRLMSSLSVGRAPANSAAEASNFVAKIKRYEGLRAQGNDLGQDWLGRVLYVSTKWGGDTPTEVTPATSFPPGDNQYAQDSARSRAIIKLLDTVQVTKDPDKTTTSPGEDRFNQAPGKAYVKLHLRPTYKNPKTIIAVTPTGSRVSLAHASNASTTRPGWFYTDWTDNDGPCRDANGQNYPTAWVIVYLSGGTTAASFDVQLDPALRLDYNLLSKRGAGDYRQIPYDIGAASSGRGWCFVGSPTDPAPSPADATGHQLPTPWLAVYAATQERTPSMFVLDPTEEADTMGEQEKLRRLVRRAMPSWDTEAALYPDVADLPVSDRADIDLQYYTQARLRAKLNEGQHIVSIGGHGNPSGTCYGGEGGEFDCGLADALTNSNAGILYANSCLTNRYTEDSLSRHLVMKNAGGMVGYVGYIDVISIGLGHSVEDKFFSDLSKTGVLGIAVDARAGMVVPGSGFDINSADLRYTAFMMALLGDPALKVHGADYEYLTAIAVATVADAAGNLNAIYLRPDHRVALAKQDPAIGGWARARVIDRGSWASQLSVVPNADGRLECFYIGSDHKLYHLWQTSPNGEWSQSWVLDNGSYAKQLATARNADKRIEVFYIGSDDKTYHIWQTKPNNGWTKSFVMDNNARASQLAVAANKDGRLEAFSIGLDNKIYHQWQTAPNSGWSNAGVLDAGSHARQLAVAANADQRIEVVYIGSDNKLYHLWQTAPNNGWSPSVVLDIGSYAKQLALGTNQDGRIEVFYTGSDDKVYHLWQTVPNGGWSPSGMMDNNTRARMLSVGSNADRRLEVVFIGLDDRLYHIWQTRPNNGWSPVTLLKG